MATLDDDDLKNIKYLIDVTFDEKLDEKLDEKIKHLPSKDEFATANAKIMKELRTVREEQKAVTKLIRRNTKRIEKLEKIHHALFL